MTEMRELEFELRRLRGIAAVGFEQGDSDVVVQILLDSRTVVHRQELRRQVVQRVREHLDQRVVVEVEVVPDPWGCRPPRVQVLAVRPDESTRGVEIHLSHRGQETIGRGSTISPDAAAAATLEALTSLGATLPFRVDTLQGGIEGGPVIVIAESERGKGRHYGVASGRTPEDAACRAALHAFNRYLERDDAFNGFPATTAGR